jgi:glycosyltransferase involved in cell wall biosynthesis
MDRSSCRDRLNLPKDTKIILSVSNLYSKVKGHKFLVEAIAELLKVRQDVLCVIVGDGKFRTKIAKQILKYNLQNNVVLVGKKPYQEIPFWMNACDLLVVPSLFESFGIVQIEAMACGIPVVATRNGGSEEIITSNNLGVLCSSGNSEELSSSLVYALSQTWNSKLLTEYADRYKWNILTSKIVDLYQNILNC